MRMYKIVGILALWPGLSLQTALAGETHPETHFTL